MGIKETRGTRLNMHLQKSTRGIDGIDQQSRQPPKTVFEFPRVFQMSSSLRSCPLVHAILSKFRQSFDMVQAQAGTRTRHAKLGAAVHTALAASKTFLSQEIDSDS